MKLDMHFHSTASDGLLTQQELLQRAKELGLDFIALTDHDVVSYGFRDEAARMWIQTTQSVEISAYNQDHDKSLHLTFYAREVSQDVSNVLQGVIKAKTGLISLQIARCKEYGFELDEEAFYDFFEKRGRKKETLNKFDIAIFLFLNKKNQQHIEKLQGGKMISREYFYWEYLKKGGEKFDEFAIQIPNYEVPLSLWKEFVQKCDGILSIPHPHVTFKKWGVQEFQKVLPHYIQNGGVNAIEINTCTTREWIEVILQAKEKYNLYLTFGSDFHTTDIQDGKHGAFWQINPLLPGELVGKEFSKYREKIVS